MMQYTCRSGNASAAPSAWPTPAPSMPKCGVASIVFGTLICVEEVRPHRRVAAVCDDDGVFIEHLLADHGHMAGDHRCGGVLELLEVLGGVLVAALDETPRPGLDVSAGPRWRRSPGACRPVAGTRRRRRRWRDRRACYGRWLASSMSTWMTFWLAGSRQLGCLPHQSVSPSREPSTRTTSAALPHLVGRLDGGDRPHQLRGLGHGAASRPRCGHRSMQPLGDMLESIVSLGVDDTAAGVDYRQCRRRQHGHCLIDQSRVGCDRAGAPGAAGRDHGGCLGLAVDHALRHVEMHHARATPIASPQTRPAAIPAADRPRERSRTTWRWAGSWPPGRSTGTCHPGPGR